MEYHIKPFRAAIATVLIFNVSSYAFAESAAGGGRAENAVLEEIVVTAQKREQSLRDIAASISVVSGQAISDYNVLDFTELENVTSGLFLTRINARNTTVSLRGLRVDPESGSEAAVDIYLNGASVRPRVAFGQMYDIERVEVLRGPQGAFQGKSSPAGSIQIHTRSPDLDEVGGYIQAQAGSNEALKFQGAVSIPVIEGELAIRIAGDHDRNDGDEIVNLITGKLQDHESESVRFSVAWRPSDNFNATLKYDYIDRLDYDAKPLAGSRSTLSSPLGATPTPCTFAGPIPAAATCRILTPEDRAALAATDDFSEFNADIYNLHANWYFGNHKLTYIFNRVDSEQFSRQENDATFNLGLQNALLGLSGVSFEHDFRTFQTAATKVDSRVHELRLESDREGRWQYMVGLYVDAQDTLTPFTSWSVAARYVPFLPSFPPAFLTAPIPANPMFGLPGYDLTITGGVIVGANFSTTGNIPFDSDTRALFTHHSIEVSERTTLEVALRYSEVERFAQTDIAFDAFLQEELIGVQGLTYTTSIPLPPTVTDPAAAGFAAGLQQGFLHAPPRGLSALSIQAIPPAYETFEDEVFTGMLSVRYEQSESLYFYGSYSRGYRIGGISVVPASFPLPAALLLYDPEDSDALEVGLKADFWGGRGSVNAALFYQQLDNHFGYVVELKANGDLLPPGTPRDIPGGLVFNGDAISKGIEIEGRLLLGDNLLLGMGVNYVNVEWDSALAPCNVLDPDEIVGSCDISGQRIAGEPEFSLNINAEYRVPISGDTSAFVRATYKYKGDIVSTAAQTTSEPSRETDAYSIFNLFVGIELADSWEITLWGKNLFDEDARTDLRTRGDDLDSAADFEQVLQVPQRTYGIITRYTF